MHLQNLAGAAAFSVTFDGGDDVDHAIQSPTAHAGSGPALERREVGAAQ